MMVKRSCCVLAGLVVAILSATVAAAAPPASFGGDAYGRGVQAYFAGNSAAAEQLLMEATGQDPKDPRPYYFHGLCMLRQGQLDRARSDFTVASALEARSRRGYPVGKSLERVQGGDRLMLEQYRWRAQPAASVQNLVGPIESRRRATIAIDSDAGVLRQAASIPLDELAHPVSLADLTGLAKTAPAPTTTSAANEPVAPHTATPADDPFADDQHAAPSGKVPSGKLLGIIGRAIVEAAPVPSVDSLRQQLPEVPMPTGNDQSPVAEAAADSGSEPAFAPAEEEPLFESTPAPAEAESSEPAPAAAEDDPFGF